MAARAFLIFAFLGSIIAILLTFQRNPQAVSTISVDWNNVLSQSKTTATLQVVVNPPLLRNSSIHDNAYASLSLVSADYLRFVPWFPYPKLSVPEIDAPVINGNTCTTSWDFTYADELMEDFYKATPGVSHIINFSTTPGWMWVMPSGTTYTYPSDPSEIDYTYNVGTQLRDPSLKEVSDYYSRLVSWYVKGGFTDECGTYHHSGHAYEIEYWEVLNEIEFEHSISPQLYNQLYDAIVTAIQDVSPETKFVGVALGSNSVPAYFNYLETFLNPSKHVPNIPLDFISYHWYGSPMQDTTANEAAHCFADADEFLGNVVKIEGIRKSLSPGTRTTINEVGTFDPLGTTQIGSNYVVPEEYFLWSAGVFAYVWAGVTGLGIDVVGESQLVGYPGQFPSVSMVDWETGRPNARLRVLQLLQRNFGVGDRVVQTNSSRGDVFGQAFVKGDGVRRVLLVNKLNQSSQVQIGFGEWRAEIVDLSTAGNEWRTEKFGGDTINLTPWATVVLTAT